MVQQPGPGAVFLRLLGPLTGHRAGVSLDLGVRRQRRVLGLLLLESNRPVPVERIIDLAWFDQMPPETARNAVQVCISRLRSVLGSTPAIRTIGDSYQIDADADTLDLLAFRALRRAAASQPGVERVRLLRRAEALWQGPVLAAEFPERARQQLCAAIGEERITAAEDRIRAELSLGLHHDLVAELTDLVSEHPTRERLACFLAISLYRSGRSARALEVCRETRAELADQLGIDPGPELRDLETAILRGDPDLRPPDTGRHRPLPAELPRAIAAFVGRSDALAFLDKASAHTTADPAAITLLVLTGTGGVGKTSLALYWAHRAAGQFPDGQLYVDLRGYSADQSAREPATALRQFLLALGEPARGLPPDADALAARYRSVVSGRRMLVVLDNARDEAQVRPLLPGTASCVVVVTSRHQLTGLVAVDGAQAFRLGLLDAAESRTMLSCRVGAQSVAAAGSAIQAIIDCCGRLPLALAIAAAQVAVRPGLTLAGLAAELNAARGGLRAFASDDDASDVRAVFSWSYRRLTPAAAGMFRLVGLHPGPDVSLDALASMAGIDPAAARTRINELVAANLVSEPGPSRFEVHDLLRAYAAELSAGADCANAADRAMAHYVQGSVLATRFLFPHRVLGTTSPPGAGIAVPAIGTQLDAEGWLATEYPVILNAVDFGYRHGIDTRTWELVWVLVDYLDRRGLWNDWLAVQRIALAAAERTGEAGPALIMHRGLGRALNRIGRLDEAEGHLLQTLALCQELGDRAQEASTQQVLADLYGRQDRPHDAITQLEGALSWYDAAGVRHLWAATLNNLAWQYMTTGDHDRARTNARRAVQASVEINDVNLEGSALDTLGTVHLGLGEHAEALRFLERAAELHAKAGMRVAEPDTLVRIGQCHEALGDLAAARTAWQRALGILQALGHPGSDAQRHLDRLPLSAPRA